MSRCRCRKRLLGLWGASCLFFAVSPLGAATVLFFVNDTNSPQRADSSIVRELEEQGYEVLLFNPENKNTQQQIDAAEADEVDVILISETISSSWVVPAGFSLKELEKPIISFEAYMWEDAGWTDTLQFTDFGNTGRPGDLVDHPELHECQVNLFVTEDAACLGADYSGEVEVYTRPYSLNFGFPSDDAKVIATVDEEGEFPTIFVYEAGDLLRDESEAPAVRMAFFLGQNAAPNCDVGLDWGIITDEAKDLFFAAIDFAVASTQGPGCPGGPEGPRFKRGDPNADGLINITDAVFILGFLFSGDGELTCADAADCNDSGDLNLTDAVHVLDFLFSAGQNPPPPFEECAEDPTEDEHTECSYPPCEG